METTTNKESKFETKILPAEVTPQERAEQVENEFSHLPLLCFHSDALFFVFEGILIEEGVDDHGPGELIVFALFE